MGLKEHQGTLGKGRRLEWVPNQSPVPEASAEVGAEHEGGILNIRQNFSLQVETIYLNLLNS